VLPAFEPSLDLLNFCPQPRIITSILLQLAVATKLCSARVKKGLQHIYFLQRGIMQEEWKVIWLLATGLGLACLFGYGAQKIKQSPILGYLLAGFILGPNSPGFVVDIAIADQLASIGVTLLMFVIGLNFNWKDLSAVKKIAVPGAVIVSGLSILAGTLYSMYLGEEFAASFVIGVAICVSSTVVIVRVLADQNLLHTRSGHVVVGWTIVEDLISVVGLLLLPAIVVADANTNVLGIAFPIIWVSIKILLLGVFVYFLGEKLVEKILICVARTGSHELFTLAALACVFLIAIGSSYLFGVSLALGAFIAGTIVGKTDMSHQVAANALPTRDAFAVIFFLSVGMLFNPMALTNNLPLLFGILAILLVMRPILAYLIVTKMKHSKALALTVALSIAQIGEYSFILAEEGSNLGILPDNAYDILVACAFITIGLNPLLFNFFSTFYSNALRAVEVSSTQKFASEVGAINFSNEIDNELALPLGVVVIGFGSLGKSVANYLSDQGYYVLAVDKNIDVIENIKLDGIKYLFGDATQLHILEKAQIDKSVLIVITIRDFLTTKSIIKTAQEIRPYIDIIARCHSKKNATNAIFNDISIVCDQESLFEKFITALNNKLKT